MPAALILALSAYIGTAAATFVVNFALSYLITRLFATGSPTQTDNGVRQQVPPSTNNSIPIVYGDAYLGGTFVDAVLSTDQKTMYYVLAISSISPNGQFTFDQTKMYWADQIITFDGTDHTKVVSLTDGAATPNVNTKVNGNIYINLYTSSATGTITSANGAAAPSVVMGGADIATAQHWTGTRQMNGLAFAVVKLQYSQDAGTTQMQAVTFHVSHYLNSAGAAVPGDVWYDYMTNEIYGGGMDVSLVNSTSRTALNTYSNATITFTDSDGNPSTQPRYRINGVLDTGQNVLSNIDRILVACDSWNQYNAASGQWAAVINQAQSTAFAFNDTNIIGEIKVSAIDLTSSINQVEATFPSKLNRDQTDVVFIETPAILLYPNEPINKYSVKFDLSNDSVQTHYLANRLLEQAREDLIVTINAAYPAIQVDAGDVVSLTNAAYGWTAKLFRVMKITEVSLPDGNLGASLDLSEYNAQVYDDKDITQFSPEPNSGLVSTAYFSSLTAPVVSASRPTASIPSFDVQVTTPVIGRVTNISLYYTTVASPSAGDWLPLANYETTNSQPIAQSTTYQFGDLILPLGTYYFGFIVRNDVSASILSAMSSSFAWVPTGMSSTRTARLEMFKWATSTPASFPSGTSTYTWSTGTFTNPATLNGWSQTPGSPTVGYTLFGCNQIYADTLTTSTSTVTWSTSTAYPVGYAGTNGTNGSPGNDGNSASRAYALYTGNPTVTGSAVVKTGTALPATTDFSPTAATSFTTTVQNPGSSQAMFQSDGIYNPVTNQTTWGTPYLSNLKVGSLSAISADIGSITSGSITGTEIKTAASGRRITLNEGGDLAFHVRDGSGAVIGSIISDGSTGAAVATFGSTSGAANGVNSLSGTGSGIFGNSSSGVGVNGVSSSSFGVEGVSTSNYGVGGFSSTGAGVLGQSFGTNYGVEGTNDTSGTGVYGHSSSGIGVKAESSTGTALQVIGPMTINNTTLVTNLHADNSDHLGSKTVSELCNIVVCDTGTATVAGGGVNLICTIASVRFNGSSNNVILETFSDRRLKEDIAPEVLGLDFVNQLIPVSYKIIGRPMVCHGFIAQDIEPLIDTENDSLKQTNSDGTKGVDYLSIIAPLVKAVQELSAKVEALKLNK